VSWEDEPDPLATPVGSPGQSCAVEAVGSEVGVPRGTPRSNSSLSKDWIETAALLPLGSEPTGSLRCSPGDPGLLVAALSGAAPTTWRGGLDPTLPTCCNPCRLVEVSCRTRGREEGRSLRRSAVRATQEQWRSELDELYIALSLAEANLREAEQKNRPEQALRSKEKIEALQKEISAQRARPFST
jgi:hypothetical protein